jgi:magnesium transporter
MTTRTIRRDPGHGGETAAHYVVAGVPRAPAQCTGAQVRVLLASREYDCVEVVCVLDADDRLLGVVPIGEALRLPENDPIGPVAHADWPRVLPDVDQERVASVALHHSLNSIPVVDRSNRLLGVVPTDALLRILRGEHVEDLHRLAGIGRETQRAREAIEQPPLRRLRHRLPWLVIGLVGSMIATFVMSRFEQALASKVAIAYFVPGLVYLADAIGTQTEAIAVRGLSLSHARIGKLVGGELRTGLMIGLTLGALTFPAVWLVFGEWRLAAAVATALVFAGGVATTIGLVLPWLLARLGTDPAYGSGPLATIIQDVLSLLIYFAIVSLVLL